MPLKDSSLLKMLRKVGCSREAPSVGKTEKMGSIHLNFCLIITTVPI